MTMPAAAPAFMLLSVEVIWLESARLVESGGLPTTQSCSGTELAVPPDDEIGGGGETEIAELGTAVIWLIASCVEVDVRVGVN